MGCISGLGVFLREGIMCPKVSLILYDSDKRRTSDRLKLVFFNKSMKACPYISEPYRPKTGYKSWIYNLRAAFVQTPLADTGGKVIDLAPWPKLFNSQGIVKFQDNGRPEYERMKDEQIQPDVVVLCTGYKQSFPFFNNSEDGQKQQDPFSAAVKYPLPSETDVRGIWKRDDPTIGFIGFLRPSLGAIPPLAEMQAQLWTLNLLAPQQIPRPLSPSNEPHYKVLHPPGSRINYGVDHESYAYQLALDMGSAPGLMDIYRYTNTMAVTTSGGFGKALRMPIIWAFGAHFNTKFRLQGPWKWDGAGELLVSEEFWQTITRRPYFFGKSHSLDYFELATDSYFAGHFAVSILPMCIFGPVSLMAYLYSEIADSITSFKMRVKAIFKSDWASI